MDFVGIVGNRGSGKTNIMTAYLHEYAMELDTPVIANYSLKFDSVTMPFEKIVEILKDNPDHLRDVVIGLDELGRGADSYDFFKDNAREITFLVQQIRKLGSKIFYTVQRHMTIAKRLRDQTDGFIMMSDPDSKVFTNSDGEIVLNHRDVCQGIFNARFMDENLNLIRVEQFDGRSYWNLYDTNEIIW